MVHGDVEPFDRKALVLTSALLAALYFVAGKLGLTLAFVNASATAVWPPAGIALAALLVLGYRVWPGVLLGAFLVNLTTTGGIPSSVGIAVGNTIEDRMDMLPADMPGLAARRQHLEARACCQQFSDQWRGVQDLLAVVQDQQQIAVAQMDLQ